jgi:hypothetical protein
MIFRHGPSASVWQEYGNAGTGIGMFAPEIMTFIGSSAISGVAELSGTGGVK